MNSYQSGVKAERDRVISGLAAMLRDEPINSVRGVALRDLYRRLYGANVIDKVAS
jgi:hypothetical protein